MQFDKRFIWLFGVLLLVAFLVLALLIRKPAPEDANMSGSEAFALKLLEPGASGAALLYRSKTYFMDVLDVCGTASDGTYTTWAITRDEAGEVLKAGPQMLALRQGDWSIIDFLPDEVSQIIRVYREGDERLFFNDGVLTYAGPVSTEPHDYVEVEVRCP